MIKVTKHGVVVQKRDLGFEKEGVLNPAVYFDGSVIHMLYRAVAEGNRSSIGYCSLNDPLTVTERFDYPVLVPENDYESHGAEDPRIVKIEDTYYLTYTGYDGATALGCLALSHDLKQFHKKGVIVPKITGDQIRRYLKKSDEHNIKYFQPSTGATLIWDKNLVFFPRRIEGKLTFLHRIRPGIQLVSCSDLSELTEEFWKDYIRELKSHIVLDPKHEHELSYIGNGCPPIETAEGWLLIYHGVHDTLKGYKYVACAALLDLQDPRHEIARLSSPLFEPEMDYEINGYVNFVCFPTGTALLEDTLYIYYGAADERIACASLSISELLAELLVQKSNN